jgi:hypothetical protein
VAVISKTGRPKVVVVCEKKITQNTGSRNIKHGRSQNDKTYKSWQGIKDRCTNQNHKRYKDYGGRGIIVCKDWLNFSNFLRDNGECPSGCTIERIRNLEGYYPGNCYWATWEEQARNRRSNHLETFNGKTQCLAGWSEETGIPNHIICQRLRHGWPPERALTEPVRKYRKIKVGI